MSKPVIKQILESSPPEQSAKTLNEIRKGLGGVSNFFRTVANSPAALQSLWAQLRATKDMSLSPRVREAIALRVAQLNGCDYCLATHTTLGPLAGIDATTAMRFRQGQSNDAKEQALLTLTTKIVKDRGHHAGFVVETARMLGVRDSEIIEVIALVGLHTFTNYVNTVAKTEVDSPDAPELTETSFLEVSDEHNQEALSLTSERTPRLT